MKSKWLMGASLAVVALACGLPVHAMWAPVPVEILVDEAALIVEGKVSKIDNTGFQVNGRNHEAAVIAIKEVLKGDKKIKEVLIGQPAVGGLAVSTDIRFQSGQDGVWLLNREADGKVYWARHPSQYQPAKEKENLLKVIEERKKLKVGKAVNGLEARAELIKQGDGFEVRFSVKNVSDKPIVICNYAGHRPLQVEWVGPDGQARKSSHYNWLARAFLPALGEGAFVTLNPGAVRFIGPAGAHSGIWFTPAEKPDLNTAAAGEHKVTLSYANKETGKKFELKNVWTGSVAANEVVFTIK